MRPLVKSIFNTTREETDSQYEDKLVPWGYWATRTEEVVVLKNELELESRSISGKRIGMRSTTLYFFRWHIRSWVQEEMGKSKAQMIWRSTKLGMQLPRRQAPVRAFLLDLMARIRFDIYEVVEDRARFVRRFGYLWKNHTTTNRGSKSIQWGWTSATFIAMSFVNQP